MDAVGDGRRPLWTLVNYQLALRATSTASIPFLSFLPTFRILCSPTTNELSVGENPKGKKEIQESREMS